MANLIKEIKSRVRMRGEIRKSFWTARRVRHDPLSLLLFNILMADLKDKMRKVKWRRVRLGEDRVYTLAYMRMMCY